MVISKWIEFKIGSWFETYNSLQRMNRLTKEMNYWLDFFLSYTGMSKDQLVVIYFVSGNNLREVVSLNES